VNDQRATASTPSPSATRARHRGWRRFLLEEWGLLLLALVLAILMWEVVRAGVEHEEYVRGVRIVPRTPAGHRAYVDGPIAFPLRGPRGQVESWRAALARTGDSIILEVGENAAGEDRRSLRPGRDRFVFPFPEWLLGAAGRDLVPTGGSVYRLLEQTVAVAEPRIVLPEGTPRVTINPPTVTVVAPRGVLGDRIQPDPLDLREVFQPPFDLATPIQRRLTFNEWREDRRPAGERGYGRERADVEVPEVSVTVTVVLPETEIENDYQVRALPGWTVEVENREGFRGTRYRGLVRGTRSQLDALRNQPYLWMWVLSVRDDPPPDQDVVPQVRAVIEPVWLQGLREAGRRGELRFEPMHLHVTLRRDRD
jgi:hypothetical protein